MSRLHLTVLGTPAVQHAGEGEQADEEIERFLQIRHTSHRFAIPYYRALAAVARQRGDQAAVLEHLRQANYLAEALELPGEQWSIQAAIGDSLRQQGDLEAAYAAFTEAGRLARCLAAAMTNGPSRQNFLASPLIHPLLASLGSGETC